MRNEHGMEGAWDGMGWHGMAWHGSQATCSTHALQSTACALHHDGMSSRAQQAQQQSLMPSAAAATCFCQAAWHARDACRSTNRAALALFLPAAGRRSAQLGAACLQSGMVGSRT